MTTLTAHWLSYRFLYPRARALPFKIHCPLCAETVWRRNQSSEAYLCDQINHNDQSVDVKKVQQQSVKSEESCFEKDLMVQKYLNMGRYYRSKTKTYSMPETNQGNPSPAQELRLWQESRNEMQVQCWVFLLNT